MQVLTPYFTDAKVWAWAPATVVAFDAPTGAFTVEFRGAAASTPPPQSAATTTTAASTAGSQSLAPGGRSGIGKGGLHRLDLCFEREDRGRFGARLLAAVVMREAVKSELRRRYFVDTLAIPEGQTPLPISEGWLARIVKLAAPSAGWGARATAASLARLLADQKRRFPHRSAAETTAAAAAPASSVGSGVGGGGSGDAVEAAQRAGRDLLLSVRAGWGEPLGGATPTLPSSTTSMSNRGLASGGGRGLFQLQPTQLASSPVNTSNGSPGSKKRRSSTTALGGTLGSTLLQGPAATSPPSSSSPLLSGLLKAAASDYDHAMRAAALRELLHRYGSAGPTTPQRTTLLPLWSAVARESNLPAFAHTVAAQYAALGLPLQPFPTRGATDAGVAASRGGLDAPARRRGCVDTGALAASFPASTSSVSSSLTLRSPVAPTLLQKLEALWEAAGWAAASFLDAGAAASLPRPLTFAAWRAAQRSYGTKLGERLVTAWVRDVLNLISDGLPPPAAGAASSGGFNVYEQDPALYVSSGLQRLLVRIELGMGARLRELAARTCGRLTSFLSQYVWMAARREAREGEKGLNDRNVLRGRTAAQLLAALGHQQRTTTEGESSSGNSGRTIAVRGGGPCTTIPASLSTFLIDPVAKAAWTYEPFEVKLELRRHSGPPVAGGSSRSPAAGMATGGNASSAAESAAAAAAVTGIIASAGEEESPSPSLTPRDAYSGGGGSGTTNSAAYHHRVHLNPPVRDIEAWLLHPLTIAANSVRGVRGLQTRIMTLLPASALPAERPLLNIGQHDPLCALIDGEVEATRAWVREALAGPLLAEASALVEAYQAFAWVGDEEADVLVSRAEEAAVARAQQAHGAYLADRDAGLAFELAEAAAVAGAAAAVAGGGVPSSGADVASRVRGRMPLRLRLLPDAADPTALTVEATRFRDAASALRAISGDVVRAGMVVVRTGELKGTLAAKAEAVEKALLQVRGVYYCWV